MIKIVADCHIPFLRGVFDRVAVVNYIPGNSITASDVKFADVLIIRTRTICNKSLLEGSRVKYIATATIGDDHIDKEFCKSYGIEWSNAPGCNSGSVQQYVASVLSKITSLTKRKYSDLTVGIVGYGNVGRKVAHLCSLLGMNVLVNDPPLAKFNRGKIKFSHLDKLLEESDIVTLHVPLTAIGENPTFHLAGKDFFNQLKMDCWFINTSRGEVADTRALLNALKSGKAGGAIIDVWENEPSINRELLSLVSIGTPHIAGYSIDGKANGTAECVNKVNHFFNLGLNKWYPENLPQPAEFEITGVNSYLTKEEIVNKLFTHTCNLENAHKELINDPLQFESIRNNYPVRREFGSFRVISENLKSDDIQLIRDLGFTII